MSLPAVGRENPNSPAGKGLPPRRRKNQGTGGRRAVPN
jgi:hypothetical protein